MKLTRRSMFAGIVAGAMLHVMRPIEKLVAPKEEAELEYISVRWLGYIMWSAKDGAGNWEWKNVEFPTPTPPAPGA